MKYKWKCSSQGPTNNGLVKECLFSFEFEDRISDPNCPVCGCDMVFVSDGPSVSDILSLGYRKSIKE